MLSQLALKKDIETFSVSPENITGEKGMGGRTPLEQGSEGRCARDLGVGWKVNPLIIVKPGEKAVLANVRGQGAIKHIWITDISEPRQNILRIYFDGQAHPAVEAPLSDFFANAKHTEYRQISSLPICVNPVRGMNCYFEMPYRTGFKAEIENIGDADARVYYQIDCEKKAVPAEALYFHAQFRRTNPLPYKTPYTILDNVTGCGQYVGTYLYWGVKNNGWWGEGEIKFYLDGDGEFPSICGTGTEDYFGGSHNFDAGGFKEFTSPYSGLSKIDYNDAAYASQKRFNMYRWHITDPIYFKRDIRVTIQALGWRSGGRYLPLQDDISSVAYWYSDCLTDVYPPLPDKDGLEII